MAFRPSVSGSVSTLALALSAPALAQSPPSTGGIPTDKAEQAPTGTTERTPGPSNNAQSGGSNVSDATTADTTQAVTASSDEQNGGDIIVTGVRASAAGALRVKRESLQVVDSVVAEDVGKLPDNNVVEALQRITGVQVTDRAGGETATLSIRGLPDPLTTLNGRNIFTGTGTSFALQDIPANLVKRIDVFKTRSADQIETGLAGQIDVQTRRPFDFTGFTISAIARGIYNEQADSYNPVASALISDRWTTGIGDIGILINASYQRTRYRNMAVTAGALVPFVTENPPAGYAPLQRVFPDSGAWQPGTDAGLPSAAGSTFPINGQQTPYYLSRDAVFSSDLYGKRERPAFNAALQWAPNSSSEYTAEVLYTGFRGQTFNSLMFSFVDFWGTGANGETPAVQLYDGTNIVKSRSAYNVFGFNSGDFATSKTDSWVYALNGKWDFGETGKIVADVAYQTSVNKTTFFAMRTTRIADGINADFNAGSGIPSYHFLDDSQLTDPARWTIGELYDNADRFKGDAITGQLDADYKWDTGFVRHVKAGVRYDRRGAEDFTRTQNANALGSNFATALGSEYQFTNSNFFDGRADVPQSWVLPYGNALAANKDQIRSLYNSTINAGLLLNDQLSLLKVFDITETNIAAYALADTEVSLFGRPFTAQFGVRYVNVKTNLAFTDRYAAGTPTTSASSGTHKWLPNITLRYELTDKLRLRANYGQTLRRPNFTDLNPNYVVTGDLTQVGYGTGSQGNPNLRPTQSKNYDVGADWFFGRDSAIYATLFRREIDGLVVPLTSLVNVTGTGLNTNRFLITQAQNASNGVLKGAEIGVTYFPDFLPRPFKGLGILGSLTALKSSQNLPQVDLAGNVIGQNRSNFFGVSNLSYNVTAAYDNGPVGARLSYVWRQAFLVRNEARLFANPIGVWRRAEKSLDFQLTYALNKQLGFTFDAVNLTKEKQQEYYKYQGNGGPTTDNLGTLLIARTFAIGVRYSFNP